MKTKLCRIAQKAREAPELVFTSLAHHITPELLRDAYERTRKDGATGIDGQTGKEYGERLEENLRKLHARLRSGTYEAPPVKRAYIPKEKGKSPRPIGITTFEDKVVQRAVVMILQEIYEQDFHEFSHGFRPKKSAHKCLKGFRDECMSKKIRWIIDADLIGCFDNLNHGILRGLLKRRVNDGSIHRLIRNWLKAGVMEGRALIYSGSGSPQGGVISPMMANVYLHYVLDEWFEAMVRPRLKGQACIARFADDFVIGFELQEDAERVLDVLPKRLSKNGLELHPEKTRLVDFRPPVRGRKAQTFDFLGFTHYWGVSRKGNRVIKWKTAKDRLRRTIKSLYYWCKENRHEPLTQQHHTLKLKLQGHYQYYGVTCNILALQVVKEETERSWHKWLNRRGQQKKMKWQKYRRLLNRFPLPRPRIVHRYK